MTIEEIDALIEEALVGLFGHSPASAWKAEQQRTRPHRRGHRTPHQRQPVDISRLHFIGLRVDEHDKVFEWARQGRIAPELSAASVMEAVFYYQGPGRGLGVDRQIDSVNGVDFVACRLVITPLNAGGTYRPSARYELCGMAKCNRDDDEPDINRGRLIALARALRGEAIPVKLR